MSENQDNAGKPTSNIFVWGSNENGQLALTADEMPLVQDPIAIKLRQISKIRSVACGAAHTLIVSELGLLFAMGDNSFGQLGLSNALKQSSIKEPILVESLIKQD